MTIAIPTTAGKLSSHFGHCEQFALFQLEDKLVKDRKDMEPPPHEPGLLPRWLKEQGVDLVIAGGMGRRAQDLFKESGVEIISGINPMIPEDIVEQYLGNSLEAGDNACDH